MPLYWVVYKEHTCGPFQIMSNEKDNVWYVLVGAATVDIKNLDAQMLAQSTVFQKIEPAFRSMKSVPIVLKSWD